VTMRLPNYNWRFNTTKISVGCLFLTRPVLIFSVEIFAIVPTQVVFIVTGHFKTNPELQRLE